MSIPSMMDTQKKEGFWTVIKKQFMAGLLAVFPISFSIYILFWLFQKIDLIVGRTLSRYINFYFSGFGFIILFVFIWLVGVITSSYFGSKIIKYHDSIVSRIPILRSVFRTIKQLSHTVLGESHSAFTQPVLADTFANGQYSLGFLTSRSRVNVPAPDGGVKTMLHVFIPTVPNPTTGFLFLVEEPKIIKLDITMEEAFKTILTAGLINPDQYGLKNSLNKEDEGAKEAVNKVAEKLMSAAPVPTPGQQPDTHSGNGNG